MDTFSIMESLVKLVGADEQISNYASAEQLEWLRDTTLMQMLLDRWESVGRVVRRECLGSCLVLLPGSSHTEMLPLWVAGRVQLEWLGTSRSCRGCWTGADSGKHRQGWGPAA